MNTSNAIANTNNNSATKGSVYGPFNFRHHVHHRGTINCEVSFQLNFDKMKIVREYFAALNPVRFSEYVMQFTACNIVPRGCGWYRIYTRNEKVDGACDGLKHVINALKIHAGILTSCLTALPVPSIQLESKRRFVVRQIRHSKSPVIINRAVQAARGLFEVTHAVITEPRKLTRFAVPASENMLQVLANRLNSKFHYA